MSFALPDCTAHEDAFSLSVEDRRELIRRIAQDGPGAIDAFIREREAEDSAIARKVKALRDELLRRADDLRRRLAEGFDAREASLEAEFQARLATLQDERAGVEGELARVRSGAWLDAGALQGDPVLGVALSHDRAARPPWWRRVLTLLARVLHALLSPLRWLWSKATGRKPKAADRVALAIPGATLDAGNLYLSDATFRNEVRRRLRAAPASERVKRAWERLLGLEDYESLARKMMAQMVEERAQAESSRRERELSERLASLADSARAEERRRAEDERALAAEREREARALEEAIRSRPEKEVKEAIVDELKAAGLLRESASGLAPTLQLMDRFAALVYSDEAKASGGRGGASTGEYAEGEGHYIRGPLRSEIDVSRMDIPASLLRARSRHPHVRHLTEADVVVYREERASALHVVLIVDRSGSMEENGRMDAAKRAALALHHGVRAQNPRNRVDVLLMDTSVRTATLRDVWETEPQGFTNTGGALRLAREMARRRKSDRLLVYLITDGLPEAYTKNGEDVAGHPDKAMAFARDQARLLRRERALSGFVMLLLEPENERHVKAARELAKECGGRVMDVDPQELARTLLRAHDASAPRA